MGACMSGGSASAGDNKNNDEAPTPAQDGGTTRKSETGLRGGGEKRPSLEPFISGFRVFLGSDLKGSSEIDRGFGGFWAE